MCLRENMKFETCTFKDLDYLSTEELKVLTYQKGMTRILLDDNLANLIENGDKYSILKMRDNADQLRGWTIVALEHNPRFKRATFKDGIYMCFVHEILRGLRLQGVKFSEILWQKTLEQHGHDKKFSVIAHNQKSRHFYAKLKRKYPKNVYINNWIY